MLFKCNNEEDLKEETPDKNSGGNWFLVGRTKNEAQPVVCFTVVKPSEISCIIDTTVLFMTLNGAVMDLKDLKNRNYRFWGIVPTGFEYEPFYGGNNGI